MSVKRSDITFSFLHKLYWEQKLPSKTIAKQLNCNPTTVLNHMKALGIPIRTLKEAHKLRTFTKSPGKILYPKNDFSGIASQKAYLIGFRIGDLSVKKSSPGPYSQTIEVAARTTQLNQAILFKDLFKNYGHFYQSKSDQKGTFKMIYYLNRSFDFLLAKQDNVEAWIQKDPKCSVAFAAGYIDAEGSFFISTKKSGLKTAHFAVATQDKTILFWMHRWLLSLDIACPAPKLALRKGTPRQFSLNKDHWILQVDRKASLLKLIRTLTFWIKHPKRKNDMRHVIQNIKERNLNPNLKFARRSHQQWASKTTL